MKNLFTLAVILGLLFTNIGCEKILEVKPQSQITEQIYFKSEGDFEPYLTGIYTYMRTLANNVVYGTERSEELTGAANNRLTTAWSQILSPTVGAVDYNLWYKAIGQCNLLLEKIEPVAFASDPNTKKRIKAEAYALRAYFYFHLLRVIGDCPLVLQAFNDANVPLLPRSPANDVMTQILKDLDLSLGLFPSKTFSSKYRFSYPATQALKAEASLWNAKVLAAGATGFNAAITAITEVESAGLSLLPNFRNITTTRANNEIILSAYFQRDETSANYVINALPFLSIVSGASNLDSLPWCQTSTNGQGGYQMSAMSRLLFKYTNDSRVPSTWVRQRDGSTLTYAWITKYPGNKYSDDRIADNDIIIFRLADAYLMAAEAYAGLNNTTKAVEYLNKVRQRAGIGDYTGATDQPTVEKEILDERGREFFFENKRWYDLVRFYKGGTIDIYQYVPNLIGKTTPIYWPLNATVLANNSNVKQTVGY